MAQFSIYTIGHGQLSWDRFAFLLEPFHIEMICDVRSWPYPEATPWFRREQLERSSRGLGIEYCWLGAQLGPLTQDGRVDYLAKEREARYSQGIRSLLDMASQYRTCLLGGHSEPMGSHVQDLIAQTIIRHDVEVKHIGQDGSVHSAHADLFHSML